MVRCGRNILPQRRSFISSLHKYSGYGCLVALHSGEIQNLDTSWLHGGSIQTHKGSESKIEFVDSRTRFRIPETQRDIK